MLFEWKFYSSFNEFYDLDFDVFIFSNNYSHVIGIFLVEMSRITKGQPGNLSVGLGNKFIWVIDSCF